MSVRTVQFTLKAEGRWSYEIGADYKIEGIVGDVFKKRVNKEGYFTLDVQLLKRISRFSLLVKGTNLLNERYEDINGVEMPGRRLTVKLK